jgi:hypothetical protein
VKKIYLEDVINVYSLGPIKRTRTSSDKSILVRTESQMLRSQQQNHIVTAAPSRSNHVRVTS